MTQGGVCACCVVWQVTRGPHVGERVAYTCKERTAPAPTPLGVGRRGACWLRLRKDLEVSGLHAELEVSPALTPTVGALALVLWLRDCGSTNGTRVNGESIAPDARVALKHQDLLQFGRSTVRVELGDTRCANALILADANSGATQRQEEEEEEENRVAKQAKSMEEEVVVEVVEVVEEQLLEPVLAGKNREHSDENAFQEPTRPPSCMVCGQVLSAWSVLEQHLHVNACLDQRTATAALTTMTTTSRTTTTTSSTTASSSAPALPGRKRKRQAALRQSEDEALAVALALSASLADPAQQVAAEMALVSGELAQLDAELARLQKKRAKLVKKLAKLEKTKRKVHKGEVHTPLEVRELLDVARALCVLFPATRQAWEEGQQTQNETAPVVGRRRPGVARLEATYRGEMAVETETYVTMWQRSSQYQRRGEDDDDGEEQGNGQDEELYANRLMRAVRARATRPPPPLSLPGGNVETSGDGGASVNDEALNLLDTEGPAVPDVVKRVFPNWRDNLAFLETQSAAAVEEALHEMRRMRAERRHAATDEHRTRDEMPEEKATTSKSDEEDAACAFFERHMERLLAHKACGRDCEGREDGEVFVELENSHDGCAYEPNGARQPTDADVSPIVVLSIDDSSSSDDDMALMTTGRDDETSTDRVDVGLPENSLPPTPPPRVSEPERELENGSRSAGLGFASSIPDELSCEQQKDQSSQATQRMTPPHQGAAPSQEQQLLTALKANAVLYESVLLLQPLELSRLLRYFRDDAGIQCAKTELVRFCDRHGISFKTS